LKFCPLTFAGEISNCLKIKCKWWDDSDQKCLVEIIGDHCKKIENDKLEDDKNDDQLLHG